MTVMMRENSLLEDVNSRKHIVSAFSNAIPN